VNPGAEGKAAVLQARARALAKEPESAAGAGEALEVVEFRLGAESYAVESSFVREVFPLKDFTPLPGAPAFVLGIVNLRGQILSVVDLRKSFGLPERGLGELNKIVIIRDEVMEFGILADSVQGSRRILLGSVREAPPTVTGLGARFIRGVTQAQLIVLDAGKILKDEAMVVDESSAGAQG
jgi:purine-binding chemotaxis protein CheW